MSKEIIEKRNLYKYKLVGKLAFNLTSLKNNNSKCVLNIIDFVNISTTFLTSNNKTILKVQKFKGNKICKLCSNSSHCESVTLHDSEKVLFNFPNNSLTEQKIFV